MTERIRKPMRHDGTASEPVREAVVINGLFFAAKEMQ
ncbi:hypothetical protein HDG33_002330 [Paraburkholderia sp. Cpub6]|nr:hypothetical protein [Paraburkholderia sp. Cpub6]